MEWCRGGSSDCSGSQASPLSLFWGQTEPPTRPFAERDPSGLQPCQRVADTQPSLGNVADRESAQEQSPRSAYAPPVADGTEPHEVENKRGGALHDG